MQKAPIYFYTALKSDWQLLKQRKVLSKHNLSIYVLKILQTALQDLIKQVTGKKIGFFSQVLRDTRTYRKCNFLYNKGIEPRFSNCSIQYHLLLIVTFYSLTPNSLIKELVYYFIQDIITCDSTLCKWSSHISAGFHLIYISIISGMLHQASPQLAHTLLPSKPSRLISQVAAYSDISLSALPFFSC